MRQVYYEDEHGSHDMWVTSFPGMCNHCNTSTDFNIRKCWYNSEKNVFYYFLECTRCRSFSIYISDCNHKFISMIPQSTRTDIQSKNISTLSPSFCEIYRQSQLAENNKLLEICGMGYRKALEFLVKDYVISISPSEKEDIESESLMSTIRRIDFEQIKTLAERVAWLGNDQTHYVKKHADRDLTDLKAFLSTIIKYIDMELTYREATSITKK